MLNALIACGRVHCDNITVYMFDYAITEVHCGRAVCKYDHWLKFVFYYKDAVEMYVYENENKAVRLDSHNAFLIIVLLHYKLFESA